MYDQLMKVCENNREYFNKGKGQLEAQMSENFRRIQEFLKQLELLIKELESFAGEYDFDESTPGNGYRSFIFIFDAAVKYVERVSTCVVEKRGKLLFRKSSYAK